MDDKQVKKLVRSLFAALFLMLVLTIVLIYLTIHTHTPQINNYITGKGSKGDPGKSIIGSQGVQGLSGVGLQGIPGTGSVSNNTVTLQPIYTNVPVPGDKGDRGDAGPLQVITVDTETCQLKSKYQGDDLWQILAQLPKPCEVQ